jgi:hypothetical protein
MVSTYSLNPRDTVAGPAVYHANSLFPSPDPPGSIISPYPSEISDYDIYGMPTPTPESGWCVIPHPSVGSFSDAEDSWVCFNDFSGN